MSWRLNRTATYWTPELFWLQQHFFPILLGCSTGGLGVQPLLGHGSHSSIFTPTDLNFLSPGLYNNLTPTYLLRASHLYSIQPVDSQSYPLISSTGCTSYLHRFISHLTAQPGQRSICYTLGFMLFFAKNNNQAVKKMELLNILTAWCLLVCKKLHEMQGCRLFSMD